MRILHTADWHLGKIVNGVHMTEDQRFVLLDLINQISEIKPDVIIIAGDLYDRAIPPKEAVELFSEVLSKIHNDFQIPVLMITGNHDSPNRLDFASSLLRKQDVYIQTKPTKESAPVTIHDEYGPVYFHLVPYVEPEEINELYDEDIRTHEDAMRAIVGNIESSFDMEERHVFVGHAFLQGGTESDSEERLSMIGGAPYVPAHIFSNFTYTAMGHLHQAQRVTDETIRYSGSILKYSFSEAHHKKSVTIIDLDKQGVQNIETVSLKPKRDLRTIEGYFDDLINKPNQPADDYLEISLLDSGEIIDPIGKLRKVYPNILKLNRKTYKLGNHLNELQSIKKQRNRSHEELFIEFYTKMKHERPDEKRLEVFREIAHDVMKKRRDE